MGTLATARGDLVTLVEGSSFCISRASGDLAGSAADGDGGVTGGLTAQLEAAEAAGGRPGVLCGFDRDDLRAPVRFPDACATRAWSAAAPLSFLRSLLRLDPWIPQGKLWLDPALPAAIGRLRVERIPLLGGRVTVTVEGDAVEVDDLPPGTATGVVVLPRQFGSRRTARGMGTRPPVSIASGVFGRFHIASEPPPGVPRAIHRTFTVIPIRHHRVHATWCRCAHSCPRRAPMWRLLTRAGHRPGSELVARQATCSFGDVGAHHPGVYGIAGVPPSWLQRVWAALLAVGPSASVTHETALRLHGLGDDLVPRYPLTLTIPHGGHVRVAGTIVHQIDDLASTHLSTVEGLRVSTPSRAVVDVAATVGQRRLGNIVDELLVRRRSSQEQIAACLADVARPGKPGITRLGRVLDDRGDGYVAEQSELEGAMFAALAQGGLPPPERQVPLPGRGAIEGIVDGAYRDARMVLEADGRRWHTRLRDLKRDHERDAEAASVGWQTLRFVYEQIVGDPDHVCSVVADVRAVRLGAAQPISRPRVVGPMRAPVMARR